MKKLIAIIIGAILLIVLTACEDPFNDNTYSALWTKVDPVGDGNVYVDNGVMHLSIPAGNNHDNWPTGPNGPMTPVNRSVRAVWNLPANLDHWTLETKILNTDKDDRRFAGFLVEADSNHYFRSDWDGNGSNVDLYVGVWDGGPNFIQKANVNVTNTPVQWQRIEKAGTTFTIYSSLNGTNWTQRAQFVFNQMPTKIGLNVGSSGWNGMIPAAYDAQFDFIAFYGY